MLSEDELLELLGTLDRENPAQRGLFALGCEAFQMLGRR